MANHYEHFSLTIRGRQIDFHIYVNVSGSAGKVRQLEPYFLRLPDQHLAVLYPVVFVMHHKPGGRDGGGTWRANEVPVQVMGAAHSANTLVPDADIQRWVVARHIGMIGLSQDRWERPIGRLVGSMFHEVAHCIHYELGGLVFAGASAADFPGMATDRCDVADLLVRQATEAYARYVYSPGAIYHTLPPGQSPSAVNSRLIASLRRAPAFRTVPASGVPVP
jgi:hypothetical protein